eukprot:6780401-Ditylum_brightwellii.AAC.1
MEENIEKLYGVIIGQCTDSLLLEIKGDDAYEDAKMDSDALWLLRTLKQISAGINAKKNKVQSYINKLRELMMLIQKPAESLDIFLKRFRSAVQTLELAGGVEVFLPMLKNVGLLDYTKAKTETDATKQTEMKK